MTQTPTELVRYLDPDGKPIPMLEWATLFEERTKSDDDSWWRKQTKVGDVDVSTVWLGLNHSWFGGPPLFWETMIFRNGDMSGEDQWRYSSKEMALAHHDAVVAALEAGEEIPDVDTTWVSSEENGP